MVYVPELLYVGLEAAGKNFARREMKLIALLKSIRHTYVWCN